MCKQANRTSTKVLSVVELLPLQPNAEIVQSVTVPDIKGHKRVGDIDEMIQGIRHKLIDYQGEQTKRVVLVNARTVSLTSMDKFHHYACKASSLTQQENANPTDYISPSCQDLSSVTPTMLQTLTSVSSSINRSMILANHIRDQVAKIINVQPSVIDTEDSIGELGFDSLTAAELQNEIESELSIRLPRLIFMKALTMMQLSEWILEQMPQEMFLATKDSKHFFTQEIASTQNTSQPNSLHGSLALDDIWILKQFASNRGAHNIPHAVETIHSWMQSTGFVPDTALWGRYSFHPGSSAWSRCL